MHHIVAQHCCVIGVNQEFFAVSQTYDNRYNDDERSDKSDKCRKQMPYMETSGKKDEQQENSAQKQQVDMKKAADRQDEKRVEQAFENVAVPENHKKTVHRQQQKKCAYQSGIQSDIVF